MQPKIYFSEDHHIDPTLVDSDALFVLEKLRQAGYTAYLVGGSVRDLLVGQPPKDFDISTSARPEQIKAIFQRRCILIGRRFRLAHIRFGHKIIEVATFRTGENDSDLITQDNQWGSAVEDVLRRDFTINGLFYDASNQTVIDYVGGWEDIQTRTLRSIGDPEVRFRQDPVRLLRLFKFQARFGFATDPATEEAIVSCRHELTKSSTARVLEEMLRMLESGASMAFFRLMAEKNVLPLLFPALSQLLCIPQGNRLFHYLACIDQIYHSQNKNTLDRSVLAACLIFPFLELEIERQFLSKGTTPHIGDITFLTSALIREIWSTAFMHFPRRLVSNMMAFLVTQYRITPLSGKKHYREKLLQHKDFSLALQFLKIRALVNESLVDIYTSLRKQYRQLNHHGERHPHSAPSGSYYRKPRKRDHPHAS